MYVEDIGRLYARKMVNYDLIKLKFSFSEKVIKMCAIVLMVLKFT